ncbi:hypothetical protein [Actinobacillus arthritidis]|uniref:hypothetical protein n=1 Tax=Actinobacillus arthritidis TaxID=157339 RepID=UPI0024422E2B|nr:hypothetical protein [Actinobacillus arthritidis]WGE88781.1 hypothetical protein NYR89_06620 [Actinobacillus arthritidis]
MIKCLRDFMYSISIVFSVFLLQGCVSLPYSPPTGLHIQYNSFPESAKLVCENGQGGFQDFGYTPTTLRYDIPEQGVQIGFVQTPLCKAIWVSGAEAEYQNRYAVQSNYGSYTNSVSNKKATTTDIQFDVQRKHNCRYASSS